MLFAGANRLYMTASHYEDNALYSNGGSYMNYARLAVSVYSTASNTWSKNFHNHRINSNFGGGTCGTMIDLNAGNQVDGQEDILVGCG